MNPSRTLIRARARFRFMPHYQRLIDTNLAFADPVGAVQRYTLSDCQGSVRALCQLSLFQLSSSSLRALFQHSQPALSLSSSTLPAHSPPRPAPDLQASKKVNLVTRCSPKECSIQFFAFPNKAVPNVRYTFVGGGCRRKWSSSFRILVRSKRLPNVFTMLESL